MYKVHKEVGYIFWDINQYAFAEQMFDKAYQLNDTDLDALAASIYLRSYICKVCFIVYAIYNMLILLLLVGT
jgi:hypothetical protein